MGENLGEYKVVVSADYQSLISQIEAFTKAVQGSADKMVRSYSDMADSIGKSLQEVAAAMKTVGDQPDSFAGAINSANNASKAVDTTKDKYKSLQAQMTEAARAADKAWQGGTGFSNAKKEFEETLNRFVEFKRELGTLSVGSEKGIYTNLARGLNEGSASFKVLTDRIRELNVEQQRLKEFTGIPKVTVANNAPGAVPPERERALQEEQKIRRAIEQQQLRSYSEYIAAEGKLQTAMNERERLTEFSHTKAYEQFVSDNNRKFQQEQSSIQRLGAQYDSLYRRIASYIDSNTKLSAQSFTKLRADLASIESQMATKGASPIVANPLAGFGGYAQYAEGFDRVDRSIKQAINSGNVFTSILGKMQSHLEWMAGATALAAVMAIPAEGISTIANIETEMAGMKQVLPQLQNNQALLNQTAREFIGIAGQYGLKIDEITESAKLWGRAYKDVSTVQSLLHSSSVLAVADSFSMTEANKALEATMMQYGVTARNSAEATQYSMKIVDSWTNVAHNAIVSAQDLAAANERSASAAKEAGVSFDFLQGMVATMTRNTGRPGAEVGNAIKSMLTSLHSDKAVAEIEKLGVAMYEVGQDGTKSFRDTEKVLLDLMVTTDATDKNIEKMLLKLSGGKFQYNKVASLVGDYNELIRVIEMSINSQGVAEHQAEMQLDTLSRKFQKMRDELAGIANGAGNSGLTQWLKGILDDLNIFIARIESIPEGNWVIIGKAIEFSAALAALQIIYKSVMATKTAYLALEEKEIAAKTAKIEANAAEVISQAGVNAATSTGTVVTGAATVAKETETAATVELTMAERALAVARGIASGGLTLLIGSIVTAAIAYAGLNTESEEAVKKSQSLVDEEQRLAAQLRDKEATTKAELDIMQSKIKFVGDLASVYPRLLEMQAAEDAQSEKGIETKKKVETTEHALTSMLGAEAVERIKHSSNIQQAMNDEIAKMQDKQEKLSQSLQVERQAIIDHSQITITKARERLEAIEAETKGLATEAQKQIAIYESINAAKLSALAWQANQDQKGVESSTAMLDKLNESNADSNLIDAVKNKQNEYVAKAAQSAKAYKDALDAEGATELAKIKQAVSDIQSNGNPYTPGGFTAEAPSGIVDDSGGSKKGKQSKGETEYQLRKKEFEVANAKAQYEADVAGQAYSLDQKLALWHQYMDNVTKIDDAHHQETLDWQKESYKLSHDAFDQQTALLVAKYDMDAALNRAGKDKVIAAENEIQRKIQEGIALSEYEEKIYAKMRESSNQPAGSDKKFKANTDEYSLIRGMQEETAGLAKKELEIDRDRIATLQEIADKHVEILAKRHLLSEPQVISYKMKENDAAYAQKQSEIEKNIGGIANSGQTDAMIEAYHQYTEARTEDERKFAMESMLSLTEQKSKLLDFISQGERAWSSWKKEQADLDDRRGDYNYRYQLAAIYAYQSGVTESMNGILNKTMSTAQAIRNVFSSLWKGLANQLSTDLTKPWIENMSKILLNSKQTDKGIEQSKQQVTSTVAVEAQKQLSTETQKEQIRKTLNQNTDSVVQSSSKQTTTDVTGDIGTMMVQMLEMMAIMWVISSLFGGGGDSTSESTSAVSLGRSPDSYYSAPSTISQITVPSFDTGAYMLPEDMFAMVHKREMILPADLADNIRSLGSGGASSSGGGSAQRTMVVNNNINASSIDGRGMKRALTNSSRDVAYAVKKEFRRFNT